MSVIGISSRSRIRWRHRAMTSSKTNLLQSYRAVHVRDRNFITISNMMTSHGNDVIMNKTAQNISNSTCPWSEFHHDREYDDVTGLWRHHGQTCSNRTEKHLFLIRTSSRCQIWWRHWSIRKALTQSVGKNGAEIPCTFVPTAQL